MIINEAKLTIDTDTLMEAVQLWLESKLKHDVTPPTVTFIIEDKENSDLYHITLEQQD